MQDNFVRRATVVRVIDGDTVVLDVDLGFYVVVRMSCRLLGINAPELNAEGGQEAKKHLQDLLVGPEWRVAVHSIRPDKYAGRFVGIIDNDGVDINKRMVEDGHAVPYNPK